MSNFGERNTKLNEKHLSSTKRSESHTIFKSTTLQVDERGING